MTPPINTLRRALSRRQRRSGKLAAARGLALEQRVMRLFRDRGALRVRHSVRLRDAHGNMSEIDVVAGLFRKRYIECKNYTNHAVPLADVAKFKEVLSLNGRLARARLVRSQMLCCLPFTAPHRD